MRWLIISNQHHPEHGGIGASIHSICSAAGRAGWDMHLLTVPSKHTLPGVTMHRIASPDMAPEFTEWIEPLRRTHTIRPYRYGLWSLEIARWLESCVLSFDAIEFVDCQAQSAASIDHPGVHEAHAETPRLIYSHTPMFVGEALNYVVMDRFGRQAYHQWEQACVHAADGLGTAGAHLDALIHRTRDVTLPTYVCDAASVKRPYTGSAHQHIVYVGTIEQRKGVDIGFEAVCRALNEHDQLQALFIGHDTLTAPGEESLTAHLITRIPTALQSRIRFTGALAHDAVMQWIEQAAVVVVPSRFDSFNIVAAEATLRGVPVVASPHVGICRFAPSLQSYPENNADDLADALDGVLRDREGALARVRAAQQELLDSCSWQMQEAERRRWLEIAGHRTERANRTSEIRNAVIEHLREVEAAVSTVANPLNLTERYVDSRCVRR